MTSEKTALVTGANGFVGSHLCEQLIRKGFNVRALVRKTSNLNFLEGLDLKLVYGELSNPETLPPVLDGVDFVFHPAGLVKARDRETFFKVNQRGTRNLIEAVSKKASPIKRFVHISSQAASGPSDTISPVTEKDTPKPVSNYGESKLASEEEVLKFKDQFPVTIIRPPAVYGPRDSDVFQFYKLVKSGLNLKMGFRQKYVSLVHVEDLAKCIIIASEHANAEGEIFYASNNDFYSVDEIIEEIASIMKRNVVNLVIPEFIIKPVVYVLEKIMRSFNKVPPLSSDKLNELSQQYWLCSSEKANSMLGWQAEIPVSEGLKETYNWYKQMNWI